MLRRRTNTYHGDYHVADADKHEFQNTPDILERHDPLSPLCMRKKIVDSNS